MVTDTNALNEVLKSIDRQKDAAGLPPVHLWNPPYCGDIGLEIKRSGTWYYQGSPIGRIPMVKLFSSILRHDEDGAHYVVTPAEKILVTVEDAPFVAVELDVEGAGETQKLVFTTLTDDVCLAGGDNPIRVAIDPDSLEPSPYVLVRARLEALIARPVFYRLVDLCVEETHKGERHLGVWSAGVFFPVSRCDAFEE